MRTNVWGLLLGLCAATLALAQSTPSPAPLPNIRIILVGDSTVAVKNGWGPGFCDLVVSQVACVNMAKNGRSSGSYRAEGSWAKVMEELSHNAEFKATYVLLQFGHNDQPGKPVRSTDLATEFPVNLQGYIKDVKAAGGKPVLLTSLTRRQFINGKLVNDLVPWAEATRKVAAQEGIPVLDLNSDSAAAVQQMGPTEANTLAMAPPPPAVIEAAAKGNSLELPKKPTAAPTPATTPASGSAVVPPNNVVEHTGANAPTFDYTHLGEKGSAFFGRMVADELRNAVPELKAYIKP